MAAVFYSGGAQIYGYGIHLALIHISNQIGKQLKKASASAEGQAAQIEENPNEDQDG